MSHPLTTKCTRKAWIFDPYSDSVKLYVCVFFLYSNVLGICLNLSPLTATIGITDEEIHFPGYQLCAFQMPFA